MEAIDFSMKLKEEFGIEPNEKKILNDINGFLDRQKQKWVYRWDCKNEEEFQEQFLTRFEELEE